MKLALFRLSPSSLRFTLLLGLVAGLPALSIDLSAPTLALLPAALNTSVFVAGLSLSLFVLGFGLGQYVGGRSSDQIGRRPVLIIALTVYTLAGACCSIVTNGGELATARLFQGLGAGACSVQAYAMVQDLFVAEAARRKQAYVSVVLTLMPMLAPALGAALIMAFGWRSVHTTMAVGGLGLIAIVVSLVPESRPAHYRPPTLGLGLGDSRLMLRDPAFSRIVAVNALSYAAIFTYIAGAPVVVIAQFGSSTAVYAAIFASTAAALSGGAMASARLSGRLDSKRLVWPALLTQAIANAALLGVAVMLPVLNAWFLLPPLLVSCFARGIVSPNLVHAAISSHREQAGLAAALVGLAQLLTAAIASALLAQLLGTSGAISVALFMAGLTAAAILVWVTKGVGNLLAPQG